ncbi:MAG: lipoprotein-releasing ABC transporter permease subunit [Betaproteobacteria bacterium]|nr:lipoprotein-releasing ABC transporter permease subunit [Betaproteobacteria bacterium]
MQPYELFVGLRYTRAKRRNHFISFISLISMAGIGLGVMALITVLSVMNGFQKELRTRILGVASHVQIASLDGPLVDWPALSQKANQHPKVRGVAPFVNAQGLISNGQDVQGVMIRGIVPEEEARVADIGNQMKVGDLNDLRAGEFGIVLGSELALSIGARVGDKVMVIAPQGQVTPAGILPRIKQFTLIGVFEVGMYEYDSGLALVRMEDAQRLYRMDQGVSGIRLKLDDLFQAPVVSSELNRVLPQGVVAADWTRSHANFFRAVAIEKRVMFIILTLIVAVAAFNIVSTLVMVVTDKQSDIAILRTLGATPTSILKIFMVQGSLIGVIGTLLGVFAGVLLALNVDVVVPAIENAFGIHFLDPSVYYIKDLPSELLWSDVITIGTVSLVLSLVATLYPSRRAAKVNPAEALRYE